MILKLQSVINVLISHQTLFFLPATVACTNPHDNMSMKVLMNSEYECKCLSSFCERIMFCSSLVTDEALEMQCKVTKRPVSGP